MWVRPDAAELTVLSVLADACALSVHVVGAFPLSHAADAHRLSMRGGTHGKIVVLPGEGVGLSELVAHEVAARSSNEASAYHQAYCDSERLYAINA